MKSKHSQQDVAALYEQLDTLQQQVQLLQNQTHGSHQITTQQVETLNNNIQTHIQNQTNNNNNIQININAYGKEDMSYIKDHPNFKRFMLKCFSQQHNGLCEYVSKKHFHPDHPENHNIRKLNKKDNFIQVHDGKKWKTDFKKIAMDDLFTKIAGDFRTFLQEAFSDAPMDTRAKAAVDRFMEAVGTHLEWDLNCDNYEFEDDECDDLEKEKNDMKKDIFDLVCEHVYQESKSVVK